VVCVWCPYLSPLMGVDAKFLKSMGVASIIAGAVLIAMAMVVQRMG
jgi:hypothetical protein